MNSFRKYSLAFLLSFSLHISLIWTLSSTRVSYDQNPQARQLILLNILNESPPLNQDRIETAAKNTDLDNQSGTSKTSKSDETEALPDLDSIQNMESTSSPSSKKSDQWDAEQISEDSRKLVDESLNEQNLKTETFPAWLELSVAPEDPTMRLRELGAGTPESTVEEDITSSSQTKFEYANDAFTSARFVDLKQPPYPLKEKMKGHAGTVLFHIHITSKGEIHEVKTIQTSGYPELDKISEQAIWEAQLIPARRSGVPIASIKSLKFTYILD